MSEGARINGASLLCGAVLGASVGAVLGWLLARRQMEKQIAVEVAGVKKYYSDKARSEAASGEDGDAGERAEAPVADPGRIRRSGLIVTQVGNPRVELVLQPDHPALAGLEVVGDGEDEDEADGEEDDDSPPEPVVRDTTRPYVISASEFYEGNETYNKITVTYFTVDDVLTDERQAPIRDKSIVGADFADHFGEQSDNDHIVHIRNDQLTVDFEVVREENSYTESVLGYGKPP